MHKKIICKDLKSRKSKDNQYNVKMKKIQTMVCKTLHRKQKDSANMNTTKTWMNAPAPDEEEFNIPLMIPTVLLLSDAEIIILGWNAYSCLMLMKCCDKDNMQCYPFAYMIVNVLFSSIRPTEEMKCKKR